MVLQKGEKVFIITRRLFQQDLRRHFAGEVIECDGSTARVSGYAFVYDDATNDFIRREEIRTRIFSLVDGGLIINLISADANLEDVRYTTNEKHQRILTDGKTFQMNISEFSARM